jgi:hypothetical protein
LAESCFVFKARHKGLIGEALNRNKGTEGVDAFSDLADRRESRPLGRRGVKLGDCEAFVACAKRAAGGAV